MRSEVRATARRQLDKRLNILRNVEGSAQPARGWIRAIREALGMTIEQFGRRMGVVKSRVVAIEKGEVKGSVTLESLERAAHALDCRLVYALVPRQPLDRLVEERARLLAEKRLSSTSHSMALEAQGVEQDDEEEQRRRLIQQIIEKSGSKLWEDE